MTAIVITMLWCLLFLLSWPLAVMVLLIFPLIWLISLPFRMLGLLFAALFALLVAILFLPARLLGWRSQ